MRTRSRFIVSLSLIALFLGGCGAARQSAGPTVAATQPSPTREMQPLVAIRDGGILRFVDPMTGNERWRFGDRDANLGLAVGADGVLFASVTAAAGDSTDIVAISLKDFSTEQIGAIPASAYAKRVFGDGAHLSLLRYAGSGDARAPDQLLDFPIPDRWRGTRRGLPSTVAEGSVVSLDGRAWYRVDGAMLEIGDQTGASSAIARLPLPAPDAFTYSLLMAPDGRTLYVVDYRYGESVYVIDVVQRAVVRTAGIRPRETTKQPPCAASVSPQGDRLYIAARNGLQENGIDVIDTTTMQRITTILPDRTFYCLAVSPDGNTLYATDSTVVAARQVSMLTTIDSRTNREERTVPIAVELVPGLAFAVMLG